MSRFCIVVLEIVLVQIIFCNVVTVETSLAGEEGVLAVPVENVQSFSNELKATDEKKCAKVGEYVSF